MKTIGVLTSSSPVSSEILEGGISFWQDKGYRLKFSKNFNQQDRFLAGSDEQRLEDLHEMFKDESVDYILQAGGGYGSARLLSQIDYDLIQNNKKPFIGLSDTTALQLAFLKKAELVSFSGYLLKQRFAKPLMPYTELSLIEALNGREQFFSGLISSYQDGEITGKIIGGCFSLFQTLIGTPYLPDLTDAILVLEDVGEQPYVIDRMLSHLENAGVFQKIKALVFGCFFNCFSIDKEDGMLEEVLSEWENRLSIPVFSGLSYGHQADTIILPIGGEASLIKGGLHVQGVNING